MVVVGHVVSLACLSSIGVSRSAERKFGSPTPLRERESRHFPTHPGSPSQGRDEEEKVLSLSAVQCGQMAKYLPISIKHFKFEMANSFVQNKMFILF